MAIVGLFVLPVGLVCAFRLGRPRSLWARLFYRDGRQARSVERFGDEPADDRSIPARPTAGQSAAGSG